MIRHTPVGVKSKTEIITSTLNMTQNYVSAISLFMI